MTKAKQTKTRVVGIYLELETSAPLKDLKRKALWESALDEAWARHDINDGISVRQVTATVQQSVRVK